MIYANIDAQGREALQNAMKAAANTKWFLRLKLIDLSGQVYSVPELAQMFDLCAATIRRYIHGFNEAGIAGLRPAPASKKQMRDEQLSTKKRIIS